ncbi:MAG: tRNA pseudouridine(55) synthase TruB, partial [Geobacteraceae bacterium GWB2_52_12]
MVSRVRRILGTRKVGHTGTLDPFATGVLPVAVNDGTKAIPFLDEGIKCYEAVMRLGVTTDTLDITGTVQTETDSTSVGLEQLIEALSGFTGSISQTPPMFSAIKQNGQPLYKLARKGIEVERKARQVEIIALDLLSFTPPYASIRVTCSRGTYVRSLADDIGAKLGCGAVLQDLRRTVSGPFTIGLAVSLEKLEDTAREGRLKTLFLSPYAALGHLADIELDDAACGKVRHGQSPAVQDLQ